jgi:hypothetical protein
MAKIEVFKIIMAKRTMAKLLKMTKMDWLK